MSGPIVAPPRTHPTPPTITDDPIVISLDLEQLYNEATQVPENVKALLPNPEDNIPSLLTATNIPPLLTSKPALPPVESIITNTEVRWDEGDLFRLPVPPSDWLGRLELKLPEKLRSSPRPISLQHPTAAGHYFPLWVVNVWRPLQHAAQQREGWAASMKWLQARGKQRADIGEAKELMERMSWGMIVWPLSEPSMMSVGLLSELLSSKWLRERHFELFASYLASRNQPNVGKWWIGDANLAAFMLASFSKRNAAKKNAVKPRGTLLDGYRDTIIKGGYERLIFPANINGNHWIVFSVEVAQRKFCFGTCLALRSRGTCIY